LRSWRRGNETLEYRDKRTFEPRKWKILEEPETLHSVKMKPGSPGKGNTKTMKRKNGAFGNGHPRALEKGCTDIS
jgi:hypothetical protein